MSFNSLNNEVATGLIYFIDDLNTRFTNLLFKNITGYKANYLGLARLDINGIPKANDSTFEYHDALFDDNYHLVSFYIEASPRPMQADAFEASVDLVVSVNMDKFTGYKEEGIIKAVFDVMRGTAFNPQNESRDFDALRGVVYPDKVPDSLYPHFVFRISTKLLGNLKVN